MSTVLAFCAGGRDLRAQPPSPSDAVELLLQRLEQIARAADANGYRQLLADSADRERASDFSTTEFLPGATRAVVHERNREQLVGAPDARGYRLIVQAFIEYGARGRLATWSIDVKWIEDEWRIVDQEGLTAIDNLYRLALNTASQFAAHDLKITAEDFELNLATGSVFVVNAGQGVTGLVLLGQGSMRFHPAPETEKGQVKIFSGTDVLESPFEVAFIRVSPDASARLVPARQLAETPVDPRRLRRAQEIFREEASKSFTVDLSDLSRETWSFLPTGDDVVAEVRTRRFDTLTYARSWNDPEDVTLFNRKTRRNIAVYASKEKLAQRGRFYSEDDSAPYDVLDYDIDVALSPDRQWLDGRARLLLKVRAPALNTLTLRLADPLVVLSIVSEQFGPLFGIRVKNQNSIVVSLPETVARDRVLALTVHYAGRLEPQKVDREAIAFQRDSSANQEDVIAPEPSYLYSNRSYWYPQSTVSDYATARLRITVPALLDCVASGDLEPGFPTVTPARPGVPASKLYLFTAAQPLRYLAFIVSRFVHSDSALIDFPDSHAGDDGTPSGSGAYYRSLGLSVDMNPGQIRRGRELAARGADIARFYASLVGDCPYPSFTIAVVESDLPGGHSPGYFAKIDQPLPTSTLVWRNDPTAFSKFPEFFVAHEIAHQWWGQAIGWRNYHEQWLSEGFAQYFAALYAEHEKGKDVFASLTRQMGKWGKAESDQGPVYLGYRLGHIRGEGRVFRALVYNKAAMVLHMLRRLVGDERFFRGVRRFYGAWRFRKAGTEDFRLAMEAESGMPLERFFERWIYGSTLPRLKFSYTVAVAEVVLHVEQVGELFDIPLVVTIEYVGQKPVQVVVPVTERTVDMRVALAGTLRGVEISQDEGTMVEMLKD